MASGGKKITNYAAYGVAAASITSSNVRSPARGVLTSTAMLPGGCRLVRINSCACGILVQGNTSLMQGSMRRSSTNWLARSLLEVGEMRALHALLPHPHIARVEGEVVARSAGTEHDHAAALHDQAGDRERRLARMLEHDIDVALAGDVPDRLAELARLLDPGIVVRRADLRHLAPAGKLLAVDHALGTQLHHIVALAFIRDDADGVGTGSGRELHAENAEAAGGAPYQHVVARLQGVRRMAIEHAIGGGERERVAGRFLPSEVRRLRHELTRLHAAELRE